MIGEDLKTMAARVTEAVKRGYPPEVIEQILTGDYIPGGSRVKFSELRNLRDTDEPDHRCCQQTGNDIQSGPIYCGQPAVKVADCIDGSIVCVCKKHAPNLERRMRQEETRRKALAHESLTSAQL